MITHALRPWTDLVKLHPDVEAGALTEAVFAVDLGAIAANDKSCFDEVYYGNNCLSQLGNHSSKG